MKSDTFTLLKNIDQKGGLNKSDLVIWYIVVFAIIAVGIYFSFFDKKPGINKKDKLGANK